MPCFIRLLIFASAVHNTTFWILQQVFWLYISYSLLPLYRLLITIIFCLYDELLWMKCVWYIVTNRSMWRRGSTASRPLGLRVRIPLGTWVSVCLLWVLLCEVEICVSGWALVQRSPTECVSVQCLWLRSPVKESHDPESDRRATEK